jgi:uncharacterized membrane protein
MRVNASHQGRTGSTRINQTNAMIGAAAGAGISAKLLAILIAGGAAAVAGTVIGVTRNGGNNNPAAPPTPIGVTPGTPVVGPPR